MPSPVTAILVLDDAGPLLSEGRLDEVFDPLRGVLDVEARPAQSMLTVRFDNELTALAEIVRLVEDLGAVVASVAPRLGATPRGRPDPD